MSEATDEPDSGVAGEGRVAQPSASDVSELMADDPSVARRRWIIVFSLALITLIVDQATKAWVLGALEIGQPKSVLGPLQFNLAFNTGMAFSRGANSGPIIGVIAIGITGAMIYFARSSVSRFQWIAMGAIIGGALGNVVDRLLRVGALGSPPGGGFMSGAVVDFIDVQFWPIFNVADMAVVVGGFALAISMLFVAEDDTDRADATPPGTDTPDVDQDGS